MKAPITGRQRVLPENRLTALDACLNRLLAATGPGVERVKLPPGRHSGDTEAGLVASAYRIMTQRVHPARNTVVSQATRPNAVAQSGWR
jgi:hypothetical protein